MKPQYSTRLYPYFLSAMLALLAGCTTTKPSATGISQLGPANNVALLLPLSGPLGHAGQAVRDGFLAAYYQAKQQGQTTPNINFYNTQAETSIIDLYGRAISQGASMVIGPLDKNRVAQLANSGRISVPTLALNELPANKTAPANLMIFSLSQTDEASQIATRAWQDGHRRALLIIPVGAWGNEIGQAFAKTWQAQGGTVVDRITLQAGQNVNLAIQQLLQVSFIEEETKQPTLGKKVKRIPQPRQDADLVFMALPPELAIQIKPLLQFYYADNLAVYATSMVIGSQPSPNENIDMHGVIVCDMPWVSNHPQPFEHASQKSRLYALGMDAYQLSQNLVGLTQSSGITGSTGILQLNGNNQIVRQLVCRPYSRDRLQPIAQPKTIELAPIDTTLTAAKTSPADDKYIEL